VRHKRDPSFFPDLDGVGGVGGVGDLARQAMALEHCLLLVRHGQTAWNAEDRVATHTDVPLSEIGQQQALTLATSLRGACFETASSSPRVRALITAQIGLSRAQVQSAISVDERLVETDAGPFEGLCFADFYEDTEVAREYQAYAREINPIYPPGAEHHEITVVRVRSFLNDIEATPGRHIAFSHGALMRILVCVFLGQDPCYYRRIRIDNCHGVLLKFYPAPPHQLAGLNLPPTS